MLAAAIGSGVAFAIMNRQTIGKFHLICGSIAMGMAIVTMHYTGMASMQMAARITSQSAKLAQVSIDELATWVIAPFSCRIGLKRPHKPEDEHKFTHVWDLKCSVSAVCSALNVLTFKHFCKTDWMQ